MTRHTREQVIAGLRELAAYLAAHPTLPTDYLGDLVVHVVGMPEQDRVVAVCGAAYAMGVPVDLSDGHGEASVTFAGGVRYSVMFHTDDAMAAHAASSTYHGAVQPDPPAPAADPPQDGSRHRPPLWTVALSPPSWTAEQWAGALHTWLRGGK